MVPMQSPMSEESWAFDPVGRIQFDRDFNQLLRQLSHDSRAGKSVLKDQEMKYVYRTQKHRRSIWTMFVLWPPWYRTVGHLRLLFVPCPFHVKPHVKHELGQERRDIGPQKCQSQILVVCPEVRSMHWRQAAQVDAVLCDQNWSSEVPLRDTNPQLGLWIFVRCRAYLVLKGVQMILCQRSCGVGCTKACVLQHCCTSINKKHRYLLYMFFGIKCKKSAKHCCCALTRRCSPGQDHCVLYL